jgi:hypothetical protein
MIVVLVEAATIEVLDKKFMVKLQFPVIITSDPGGAGRHCTYTFRMYVRTVPEVYNNYNNRLFRCMHCQ